MKNYSIAVRKHGDSIRFLRKIVSGGVDDSYGIEVAKLAGIPKEITTHAENILENLLNGKEVPLAKSSKKVVVFWTFF